MQGSIAAAGPSLPTRPIRSIPNGCPRNACRIGNHCVVSIQETIGDASAEETVSESAKAQVEAMERERLAVYVSRSRVPRWYFPFLGIATGVMVASNDLGNPFLTVAVVLLYSGSIGFAVGTMVSEAGVVVRLRGMPAVLLRPLLVFMAVAGVVLVGGMLVTLFADVPWSFTALGVAAGLVVWLGGWLTLHVYDSRATRLADAAGVER